MDPKGVAGINRLYEDGDIQTEGNICFAPTAKHIVEGMSNEQFFSKYASELLVFNGLDYFINNHSPCSRYMATGSLDRLAYPTFAALVAACHGQTCPLSFLTSGNYSATGKDHWSIGSMMFMGPGIRGNRSVGATDDGQFAVPIHSQTLGLDRENGIRVRPEHIHVALRELVGISDHEYCRQFPFKVKDGEKLKDLWTGAINVKAVE